MNADEYTPTTDQVRAAYVVLARALGAEFDRWLAAHDAETRRQALKEAVDWAESFVKNPTHCIGCEMANTIAQRLRALAEKGASEA